MALFLHGKSLDTPLWITAFAPTHPELAKLRALGFDADSLAHALDKNERPRLRVLPGGEVFVVIRTAVSGTDGIPVVTAPLAFLMGDTCGLTIAAVEPPFAHALRAATDRECRDSRTIRVVLRGLELSAEAFLTRLDELGLLIERAEDRLAQSLENREVLELLRYQKSLVHMSDALESMQAMLERLQKHPDLVPSVEDRLLLEDVGVELHQARETTDMARDVLSEMMDAFASIISNNLNVVMKRLASLTVLLTVPVIVTSVYGMNIELPGQRSPYALMLLLLLSLAIAGLLAVILRRRRWL